MKFPSSHRQCLKAFLDQLSDEDSVSILQLYANDQPLAQEIKDAMAHLWQRDLKTRELLKLNKSGSLVSHAMKLFSSQEHGILTFIQFINAETHLVGVQLDAALTNSWVERIQTFRGSRLFEKTARPVFKDLKTWDDLQLNIFLVLEKAAAQVYLIYEERLKVLREDSQEETLGKPLKKVRKHLNKGGLTEVQSPTPGDSPLSPVSVDTVQSLSEAEGETLVDDPPERDERRNKTSIDALGEPDLSLPRLPCPCPSPARTRESSLDPAYSPIVSPLDTFPAPSLQGLVNDFGFARCQSCLDLRAAGVTEEFPSTSFTIIPGNQGRKTINIQDPERKSLKHGGRGIPLYSYTNGITSRYRDLEFGTHLGKNRAWSRSVEELDQIERSFQVSLQDVHRNM